MAKPRYKRNSKGQFDGSVAVPRKPAPPASIAAPTRTRATFRAKVPIAGLDYSPAEQIDQLNIALSSGFTNRRARKKARAQLTELFGPINWSA